MAPERTEAQYVKVLNVVSQIIGATTFIICLYLCVQNTYSAFEIFRSEETTTTSYQVAVDSYQLPTIVICAENPEKASDDATSKNITLITLDDFEQNTLNPRKFLINLELYQPFGSSSLNNHQPVSTKTLKQFMILTLYRFILHSLTIELTLKVY